MLDMLPLVSSDLHLHNLQVNLLATQKVTRGISQLQIVRLHTYIKNSQTL